MKHANKTNTSVLSQSNAGTNNEITKVEVKSMNQIANKAKTATALCLSIIHLLSAFPAMAAKPNQDGGNSGGGGNAVVCFSEPAIVKKIRLSKQNGAGYIENGDIQYITSVEMLDLRKAKQARIVNGVRIVNELLTAMPNESEVDFEARLRGRFKDVNPAANQVLEKGINMITEFRELQNGIAPIDDVGIYEIYNTDNCVRATIIAQYEEGTKTHAIYDERIYSLPFTVFNVENRVASRWHEYLYALARKRGTTNSQSTQTLVGRLFLKNLSFGNLVKAIWEFEPSWEIINSDHLYGGFFNQFAIEFNEDLEKNNLADYSKLTEFDSAAYGVLLPVFGAALAVNIKKRHHKKSCDKQISSRSTDYEANKITALNLLDLHLSKMKGKLPLNSNDIYQEIVSYATKHVQNAQLQKENTSKTEMDIPFLADGSIYCKFKYNFIINLEEIPKDLYKAISNLNL